MATATTHTPDKDIDLPALVLDAQRRLETLRPQRSLLSLPALADPDGPESRELANVESEIAASERQLEQAELATAEQDRLAEQERKDAETKRLTAAQADLLRLNDEYAAGERAVDAAFAKAAEALAKLHRLGERREGAAVASALDGATSAPWARPNALVLESAFMYALAQANVPPYSFSVVGHVRPYQPLTEG